MSLPFNITNPGFFFNAQLTSGEAAFVTELAALSPTDGDIFVYRTADGAFVLEPKPTGGAGGVTDGDKGDITVSLTGTQWTIDNGVVTEAKLNSTVNASLDLADTAVQPGDLATVATSGAYSDLTGTPDLSVYDNFEPFTNEADFPATGNADVIYLETSSGTLFRWTGSAYVTISAQLALGETSSTAYRGDRGATAFAHTSLTNNPHSVTKAQVGLSDVPNVDARARSTHTGTQAISTVTGLQTALDAKPTISSGAGAPSSTPSKVGDIYIDTTADTYYVAVGTASSADWEANGTGGGNTYNDYYTDQTPDNGTYGTLGGAVNGTNTTFTVSEAEYYTGTLLVWLNGQLLAQGATEDFVETTPASGTFDFVVAPQTGDVVTVRYAKQVTNSDTVLTNSVIIDEDDMVSDSAAKVPTQQSVKSYVDGVTSAIQTQLNGKASTSHTHTASDVTDFDTEVANNSAVTANTAKVSYPGSANATELNILDGATVSTAELNVLDGITATTDELNYTDGVTSNIQTQLNGKAASSHTHTESDITDLGSYLEAGDAVMGTIVHGATAGTARPSGFDVVIWIGSVEPTNATNDDIWYDIT